MGWAFGAATSCTNAYSCTVASCPSTCGRINQAAWATTGALIVCGGVGVLSRGARSQVVAAVLAGASLITGLVLMSRW